MKKCPVTFKISYSREEAAEAKVKEEKTRSARPLRIYKCEFCPDWHLSHHKKYKTF